MLGRGVRRRTQTPTDARACARQVGAVSIDAALNCEAFASAHSSTSHYDRDSFVGLAWRPHQERICCEVYSTGRANLPGSRRERELLGSWARMMGQLLAHSDKPETALLVPAHLRDVHRPRDVERDDAPVQRAPIGGGAAAGARSKKRARAAATSLWDEDGGGAGGSPLLPPLMATGSGAGGGGGGAGLDAFDLGEAEAAEALLAAAGF